MLTEKRIFVSRIALLVDIAALVLAFPVAYYVQTLLSNMLFKATQPLPNYFWLILLVIVIWVPGLVLRRLHHYFSMFTSIKDLAKEIVLISAVCSFLLMGVLFILNFRLSRSLVFHYIFFLTTYLFLFKYIFHSYLVWLSKTGKACRNVLIVGTGKMARKIIVGARRDPVMGMRIIGCVVRNPKDVDRKIKGIPVIGIISELSHILHNTPIDEVILAIPSSAIRHFHEVIQLCEDIGITCRISSGLSPVQKSTPLVETIFGQSFVSFNPSRKPLNQMFLKYSFDFVISLFVLLLTAPLFIVICLSIWISSGGPAFFIQKRHGLNGRRFNLYKFRTMVVGAEKQKSLLAGMNEMSGPVFKVSNDPRVTTIGRILRKTSLDELPQLINVLRGEMSLVGPRPLPIGESSEITGKSRRRLSMKPGMTCLWQVSGRNEIDFDNWMKLDLQYIDNWSFKKDLKILISTIPAVIKGKGAK